MRFPPDIQKLEREKTLKNQEELHELTSPLRIKRKMKPPVPTRPKDLPELRERKPEEKGEVLSDILTEEPKDPPELKERRLEEKGEASSSLSVVKMVQIELVMSESTSSMLIQNQGLAVVMANNTNASVAYILQRDL